MNKILAFLALTLLILSSSESIAQPTFRFPTQQHDSGDNFCIDVKTRDFTDILSMNFTIIWDPAVIDFQSVGGFNLEDLDAGDFDISNVANGELTITWMDEPPTADGVTIPPQFEEDFVLFEICFNAISSFGTNTSICMEEDPIPVVTRVGTGGINIGLFTECGLIGVEVLPVKIYASHEEVNDGDFVCVEFGVENFSNIEALQFTIEYDPAILQFDGTQDFGLPGLNASRIPFIQPGVLTFGWNTQNDGITLPDSTLIFSACFRAIGACRTSSPISITGNWTMIEAVTGNEPSGHNGTNIGISTEDGEVFIKPCDNQTGLNVVGECPEDVLPGETVCINVTVNRFTNLNEIQFLIQWNASVLEFQSSTLLAPGFNPQINDVAAGLGILSLNWRRVPASSGLTLPDGTAILRLCFKVIGDGTVSSSISFTGSPPVVKRVGSNINIGLDPDNGCVIVTTPPGLTLTATQHEGYNGDNVCVDVRVGNFNDITSMQFTIYYEANLLQLDAITSFAVPGMDASNFTDLSNGFIGVDWESAFGLGETLPDGTVAFQLCFTIIGNPNLCSPIEFLDDPVAINIKALDSGDFNIGLNNNAGNVCILDPGGFTVFGSHENGDYDDIVCVDVSVLNFVSLLSKQYSITWDVTTAEFDHLEFPGVLNDFSNSNFDFASSDVGILTLSWNDLSGQGVTLPDSTVIFRVCFRLIGSANSCSDVGFAEDPLGIFVTSTFSGGQDIGLINMDGSICMNDYLRIRDSVITHIACPGINTGEILLSVTGGMPPYQYLWQPNNAIIRDISFLSEGTYTVLIKDSAVPQNEISQSFTINTSGTAPSADAGESVGMNCNTTPTRLDGSASSIGSNFEYFWRTLDTGGVTPPSDRTLAPIVLGAGTYELEVLDKNTGCSSKDTVIVTDPVFPDANAGTDRDFNCIYLDEVELDGSASIGGDLAFNWQPINGGAIVTGTESSAFPLVTETGLYELMVVERMTGCIGMDTVSVGRDTMSPEVDAGPQIAFPCRADTIVIGGTGTSNGPNYIYEWSELNGMNNNFVSGRDEIAAEVNSTGTYELVVIDTINGCSGSDIVEVIADPNKPFSNAGQDGYITCANPTIQLDGSASSQSGPYVYEWQAFVGGEILPGEENILNPTVSTSGIYGLTVIDTITGCDDYSSVKVIYDIVYPNAVAGPDTINLGCRDTASIMLDGQGSTTGLGVLYNWSTLDGEILSDSDSLVVTVRGEGQYILEVTFERNGCFALDTTTITTDTMGRPNIQLSPPMQKFTCQDTIIQLNAIGSDNGTNFEISWDPITGIESGASTLTPKVNQPGIYTLIILNYDNGCLASKSVEVEADTISPVVNAGDDQTLKCSSDLLQLDGTGSAFGLNITYSWTAENGSNIINPTSTTPEIETADTYYLTVLDDANGCSSPDTVLISAPEIPVATITGDSIITCLQTTVFLQGSSSQTGNTLDFIWKDEMATVLSSNLNYTASEPGMIFFESFDTKSECVGIDSILIVADFQTPAVDAGADLELDCSFDNVQLSGSVDASGVPFDFQWLSLEGNFIQDSETLNPTVFEVGNYVLSATNTENGCSESDTISIILRFNLPPADALGDSDMCQDFAILFSNLPAGATGLWTTSGKADIAFPMDSTTTAANLEGGLNTFIWTLSTPDCPDYSSDTVQVTIANKPIIRNDVVVLPVGQDTILVNATANDILNGIDNWSFNIVGEPDFGSIEQTEKGSLIYHRASGYAGEFELYYIVCNPECENFCDTGFMKFTIEAEPISLDSLPNAITPNGDNLNEMLVFDALLATPEEFPDNELIIFNRWGDIVYQAKPYINNWRGTNNNGGELPQATYYYILRLDIANGIILRGDVTVLR